MFRIIWTFLLGGAVLMPAKAQTTSVFEFASSLSVHFIVVNPLGERTGADPRGAPADTAYNVTWFREIANANYSLESIGDVADSNSGNWIENTKSRVLQGSATPGIVF
jgi:hypothetical protein